MRLSADKHEGATTALGCGVLGYPIPQVPGMVGSRRPTPVHLLSSFAGVVFDRPSALPCHNLLVTPTPGFVTSRGCRLALRLVTSDRTSWSRSPICGCTAVPVSDVLAGHGISAMRATDPVGSLDALQ